MSGPVGVSLESKLLMKTLMWSQLEKTQKASTRDLNIKWCRE